MGLISDRLCAENSDHLGFIRLVNVVSQVEGLTNFLVDEKDPVPKGFRTGQVSGGVAVVGGSHTIAARHPGIVSATTQIELKAGQTLTLIAFAESVPSKELGGPPLWKFRFLKLKQENVEKGNRFSFVSVSSQNEVTFQIRSEDVPQADAVVLKRFGIYRFDGHGGIQTSGNGRILMTASPESPSHSIVVIYDDAKGNLEATVFDDVEYSIAG